MKTKKIIDCFFVVYYNQLPMNVSQIQQSIEHREDFIKFGRDFEPIRYKKFFL